MLDPRRDDPARSSRDLGRGARRPGRSPAASTRRRRGHGRGLRVAGGDARDRIGRLWPAACSRTAGCSRPSAAGLERRRAAGARARAAAGRRRRDRLRSGGGGGRAAQAIGMAEPARARRAARQPVFIRGANRPFGELTLDDVRGPRRRAPRGHRLGPDRPGRPVARAWRELSMEMERDGAEPGGRARRPNCWPSWRRKLWVVLPG